MELLGQKLDDISSTRNFSGTQGTTAAGLIEGGEAPGGSSNLSEEYLEWQQVGQKLMR
jgi:hypothetical protein